LIEARSTVKTGAVNPQVDQMAQSSNRQLLWDKRATYFLTRPVRWSNVSLLCSPRSKKCGCSLFVNDVTDGRGPPIRDPAMQT
jgi:hypothetical protein